MGENVKQLRTRIKSVDSTLHLTKAMQLVAASKIKKAIDSLEHTRSYREAMLKVIRSIASSKECLQSPFMQEGPTERTLLIVIAGDRGLAGGYNSNAFRLASSVTAGTVLPIGKRAQERYGENGYRAEAFTLSECKALSEKLCKSFLDGEFDRLMMVSTRYVSMMTQEAELIKLLPLERGEGDNSNIAAEFEPSPQKVLNIAMPEYLCCMIYAAVRESFTSEVAARRVAMDVATKNAQVMIDELSLRYNRARQGAITQEITEIVAGSGL